MWKWAEVVWHSSKTERGGEKEGNWDNKRTLFEKAVRIRDLEKGCYSGLVCCWRIRKA